MRPGVTGTSTAVIILLFLALLAPAAAAETRLTHDGNVVTITIPVDVVGAKGKIGPDGTPLVQYWEKILNDTWGAAFAKLPYKSCYILHLDLKLTARADRFDASRGSHRILVSAPTGGLTFDGTGFDGGPETSRNARTGDGTRSFEHDRDGAIPIDAPPTVVAHEFGHLFGLGDDRANGAPKTERDGTMMVGGVPGVDPNVVQRIDQQLIDRIGDALEHYLKDQGKRLPKCVSWTGPVHTEWNGALCTGTQTGTMTVGVVGDQFGASVDTTGSYTCPSIPYSGGGAQAGVMLGSFTDHALRVEQKPVAPVGTGDNTAGCFAYPVQLVIPVHGGTARAHVSWNIGSEQYDCTITLERAHGNEPVA